MGVYAHDVDDEISYGQFEGGSQIVFGARTTALDELSFLGKPRVHAFGSVNTAGGLNFAAVGLSWRKMLGSQFYIQPGIGLAAHDGAVDLPSPDEPGLSPAERLRRQQDRLEKLDLGSRVLLQPELSLGYRASERLSVELSWIHLSHAKLAGSYNPGVGDVGVRLLYRYGLDR